MLLFIASVALAETPAPAPESTAEVAPDTHHARGWLLGAHAAESSRGTAERNARLSGMEGATRLSALDANPYANTDFTAYTVELGEARIGPGEVAAGIFPHVQVATSPVFDALGAWNVRAKADVIQLGPTDVGVQGGYYQFDGETMAVRYADVSATLSERIAEPWSIHGGFSYGHLQGAGTPNLDPIAPIFDTLTGWRPSADAIASAEQRLTFDGRANMLRARVATDLRVNRRNSFILQGEAMVWGDSTFPVTLPGSIIGGAPIPANASGAIAITDAYAASLAYQASFRHLDLRFGVGRSTIPGAWLMQSFALDYRFGGPSRRSEHFALTNGKRDSALARADAP